jgi:hypothetical protein
MFRSDFAVTEDMDKYARKQNISADGPTVFDRKINAVLDGAEVQLDDASCAMTALRCRWTTRLLLEYFSDLYRTSASSPRGLLDFLIGPITEGPESKVSSASNFMLRNGDEAALKGFGWWSAKIKGRFEKEVAGHWIQCVTAALVQASAEGAARLHSPDEAQRKRDASSSPSPPPAKRAEHDGKSHHQWPERISHVTNRQNALEIALRCRAEVLGRIRTASEDVPCISRPVLYS